MSEQEQKTGLGHVTRATDDTFLPGASGNPKGGPRGKQLATVIREAIDDADDPQVYAKVLGIVQDLALHAAEPRDKLAAIKLLLDWRIPKDAMQVDIRTQGPMTEEELQQALADASAAYDNERRLGNR